MEEKGDHLKVSFLDFLFRQLGGLKQAGFVSVILLRLW